MLCEDCTECGCDVLQEDAHEFIRLLTDALHDSFMRSVGIKKPPKEAVSVVTQLFGGRLRSTVTCHVCKTEFRKHDSMLDISLDLHGCSSINQAMSRYCQAETLDGDNCYKCSRCNQLCAATKQLKILTAPKVIGHSRVVEIGLRLGCRF